MKRPRGPYRPASGEGRGAGRYGGSRGRSQKGPEVVELPFGRDGPALPAVAVLGEAVGGRRLLQQFRRSELEQAALGPRGGGGVVLVDGEVGADLTEVPGVRAVGDLAAVDRAAVIQQQLDDAGEVDRLLDGPQRALDLLLGDDRAAIMRGCRDERVLSWGKTSTRARAERRPPRPGPQADLRRGQGLRRGCPRRCPPGPLRAGPWPQALRAGRRPSHRPAVRSSCSCWSG